MTFQKGHKIGNRFTSENQPSRESKSRGKREALTARLVALEALRGSEITDPKQIAALKQIFPNVETYYGYHLTVGRMFLAAANGNVKAYEKLMQTSGDLGNDPLVGINTETGGVTVNVTSTETAQALKDIMDKDE